MAWLPSSMSSAFADPEEVRGLMARRSEDPYVVVVTPTRLDGRPINAQARVTGSGELVRWWSISGKCEWGGAMVLRHGEHLAYRPDRVGG